MRPDEVAQKIIQLGKSLERNDCLGEEQWTMLDAVTKALEPTVDDRIGALWSAIDNLKDRVNELDDRTAGSIMIGGPRI